MTHQDAYKVFRNTMMSTWSNLLFKQNFYRDSWSDATGKVEFFKKSDSPSCLESSLYQPSFLRDVNQLVDQSNKWTKSWSMLLKKVGSYLLILIIQSNLKNGLASLCEKNRAKNRVIVGWSHPFRKHPYPTLKSNLTLHDYTLIATTIIIRTTVCRLDS